jgi:hypothetical protein
MKGPIKTTITHGQPYVDEPVYEDVALYVAKVPLKSRQLVRYERVALNWKAPRRNKKGALIRNARGVLRLFPASN